MLERPVNVSSASASASAIINNAIYYMIAEFYSILPTAFIVYTLYIDPLFGLYMIAINLVAELIKLFVAHEDHPITLRPKEAANCDILLCNGSQGLKPGFPSGHMTFATLFGLYFYGLTGNILYLHIIPMMAYARYALKCHNVPQIVCGFILGVIAFNIYGIN